MASTHKRVSSLTDFSASEGLKDINEPKALKNVLLLLRVDIENIFNKYEIDNNEPSEKWRELQQIIEPYRKEWDEFCKSNICPLTPKEIEVINYFRTYADYNRIAEDNGVSYAAVCEMVLKAFNKLRRPNYIADYFSKWKTHKDEDLNDPEIFLSIPLKVLRKKISARLFNYLRLYGENMSEVIKTTTIEKLRKNRGFGKKMEDELRTLLHKYGCMIFIK